MPQQRSKRSPQYRSRRSPQQRSKRSRHEKSPVAADSKKPIWVLGVGTPTHDTGACLLRDGKILHAVNEERLTRRKLDAEFPARSITYVLEAEGLRPEEIDVVALGLFGGGNARSRQMLAVMQRLHDAPACESVHERLAVAQERDLRLATAAEQHLLEMGFARSQVRWYDHHLCHAATAFYCSPFDSATVVTFDGRGDCLSGSVYDAQRASRRVSAGGEPPGFELLAVTTFLDSVAFLYAIVTQLLDFRPFQDEGKVTGLAARGTSQKGKAGGTFDVISKAVWLEQEERGKNPRTRERPWAIRTDLTGQYYKPFSTAKPPKLIDELSRFNAEDVAAGVQDVTEHIVSEYLRRNAFTASHLCLAGGLFANVKLNQCLRQLPGVRNVYIFPHMGDGGIHVGAAMLASIGASVAPHPRAVSAEAIVPWPHVFLGPDVDSREVDELADAATDMSGVKVERCLEAEFPKRVSELLAAGSVVGLVYGRMEFGPRALGHRSILCPATETSINEKLNSRLNRTEFMPFAPVTTSSQAHRCFSGWHEDHVASRLMTMSYQTTSHFKEKCPAAVHVDGTARPQIVDERDGLYYKIVSAYITSSGLPALVNTSFNAHGDPIVCSARDAWRAFWEQNCCDALALYPYVFVRTGPPPPPTSSGGQGQGQGVSGGAPPLVFISWRRRR